MSKGILFISNTAIHGGAEEALLLNLIAALAAGYNPLLLLPGRGWLTQQCEIHKIKYICLPSIPDIHTKGMAEHMRPWVKNAIAIYRIIRRHNISLVHSHKLQSAYHGGLGAKLARVPALTHMHDVVNLDQHQAEKLSALDFLSDHIITVSKAVEAHLITARPNLARKITTIYHSSPTDIYGKRYANTEPSTLSPSCGDILIGSIAPISPLKGQLVLLEAFINLLSDFPNTRLLFVGSSQNIPEFEVYEAQLRARAAEYGDRVLFTGWVDDPTPYYKSIDIFVHSPTQFEALSNNTLLAAMAEKPVVASHIGGIPEIIADEVTGLLVPPGDIGALQTALARLVPSPDLRKAFGEAARRKVIEKFSQERMMLELDGVYRSLLSRRMKNDIQ